jgi:hypothetical protein
VFLLKHGKFIQARDDDAHVGFMEELGQGKINRDEAAEYLRNNSRERHWTRSNSDIVKDDIAWRNKNKTQIPRLLKNPKIRKKSDNRNVRVVVR